MGKKLFLLTLILIVSICTACNSAASQNGINEAASESIPSSQETASFDGNISDTANTILVNSSEEVRIVPDIAEIVYSVRTQSSTAALCQQQNTEAVSKVIALLLELQVAQASIQTSDYYMNPVYNYSGNAPRVTGYEAITSLTVSGLPIESLDNILAQSVDNGINTISSITYQASNYDESYQQALTRAVDTARQKAQVLADAADCRLGAVVNIQETSGYSDARYMDNALTNKVRSMSAKEEMAVSDAAGIMAGEIRVSASITVEYQLLSPVMK